MKYKRITREEFDQLTRDKQFRSGPFVGTFGEDYGEPYDPYRELTGVLLDGTPVISSTDPNWVIDPPPPCAHEVIKSLVEECGWHSVLGGLVLAAEKAVMDSCRSPAQYYFKPLATRFKDIASWWLETIGDRHLREHVKQELDPQAFELFGKRQVDNEDVN